MASSSPKSSRFTTRPITTTRRRASTSSWVKKRPESMCMSRISRNRSPTPWTIESRRRPPFRSVPEPCTWPLTPSAAKTRRAMARSSSRVSLFAVPLAGGDGPVPFVSCLPGWTMITFVPSDANISPT